MPPKYTAKTADKHVLYQISVQSPDAEVAFADRVYHNHHGRHATLFREDFCGTFLISCSWVKKHKDNHAYGIDLHKPTIDWGRKHNLSQLKPDAAQRVHIIHDNVLNVTKPKVHVVGAFNFSYFIFKTFPELVAYFRTVKASLLPQGIFILDAYGGTEAPEVMEEETKYEGFTYIWDQAAYNPINDHTVCHIHFKFPDRTMLRKAFTYDWRLWTLGSIQDALLAAGFKSTEVYWEGTDKDGEGNGVYRLCKKAENSPGWNAYILGLT
ncbi:MAG: class I SAM-dependent methyltransferase [Planctomycetota bacterium]